VEPGDLFVAVGRGAEFVDHALAHGAAAALVPDDAFAALAALARAVRDRSSARVVGITGSTGKTSTKDILAALSRPHARVVASEVGFNNEIGLPLTLLRIEPDTEVVIAEMGMRGLGQIAELAALARPDVGVITGVGPVHLELLGTVENVARAKSEIAQALPVGGTVVAPAEPEVLDRFLTREDVDVVRIGARGDVSVVSFEPPHLVVDVRGVRVELAVPFNSFHQAVNTATALAAYAALGLPLDRAGEGASEIAFSPLRGEEIELPGGVVLINDCYNANPVSMQAALDHLLRRARGRRTVAVLGEMAELGEDAPRYHAELAPSAARADVVVAVGGDLAALYGGTRVADAAAAASLLREILEPGDVVLVKASRALKLETIAASLVGAPA
jgi:UDP-N-acetylmuramoyl-tripeptide--D-alanyl-D-alanine ligase